MPRARKRVGPRTLILILALSLIAVLAASYLHGSAAPQLVEVRSRSPVLGTFATFIVIADSSAAGAVLSSMDSLARHLDDQLGVFGSGELSVMNASGRAVIPELSADMRNLLEVSLMVSSVTDSLFDPAMGALVRTWGFPENPAFPESSAVDSALALSGLSMLSMNEDTLKMAPGVLLDFGAVAKGYAVDRIYLHAREAGAVAALVEIGGEIRCGGDPQAGRTWRLAIRDPRGEGILETMELDSGALATSGDYESWFSYGGRRYCHILDPRTGYPETGIASVTVLSREASVGDALATAIAVGGVPLAERVPDSLFRTIIVVREDEGGVTSEWRIEAQ